jgi:hypothetical protein
MKMPFLISNPRILCRTELTIFVDYYFCICHSALTTSNEIYDQRYKLQNTLHALAAEIREHQNKMKEYNIQVMAEKNRWNKKRIQFEQNQLSRILPSRTGNYRTGTNYIQRYISRIDITGISHQVGDCLADIVDVVDSVAHGLVRLEKFHEKLILPPQPTTSTTDPVTGDVTSQKRQRNDKDLRHEIEILNQKLRSSEEVRATAWRKVLKTKAEYSISHDISSNHIPRFAQLDMNMVHSIPVPLLRQNMTQKLVPTSSTPNYPTYTPAAIRRPSTGGTKRSAPSGGSTLPSKIRPSQSMKKLALNEHNLSSSSKDILDKGSTTAGTTLLQSQSPPRSPTGSGTGGVNSTGGSESKYSAARVKERIGADGTVAPVSEPKLTKDGLYVRPAGRTRKGMDWDALRGIWIPASNANASNDEDD